jgi:hypothetical protein
MLGKAYLFTGKEEYALEFISEVESWIRNNPYPYGINWTCAMDVSIRACNLLLGLSFFKNSRVISDEFICKLTETLLHHGNFIMENLEYAGQSKLTTNHYLSDIVGLIYLGTLMPEIKRATDWLDFGKNELIKEMEKQVYDDGSDFEGSTCYQRLVTELFFYGALLVVVNDDKFTGSNYRETCISVLGESYTMKLYAMIDVILHLLKPNGKMPQIGDNDSGRLYTFGSDEVLDMRYLLTFGAIFFNEHRFKIKEFGFCEDAMLIFGEDGYCVWKELAENSVADIKSKSYPDTGWYVMRNNKDYCIVSCGPNGGDGWHSHNDKLSFELVIDGHDVIVDPGTYVYTSNPEERNKFRSTEYHNTVKFNGYEQNELPDHNMFYLPDRVKIIEAEIVENEENITFRGEIQYAGLSQKRIIRFDKRNNDWLVDDCINYSVPVGGKLLFNLSPEITFNGNSFLTRDKQRKIAMLEIEDFELTRDKSAYSPEYGVKVETERLSVIIPKAETGRTINTRIKRYNTVTVKDALHHA